MHIKPKGANANFHSVTARLQTSSIRGCAMKHALAITAMAFGATAARATASSSPPPGAHGAPQVAPTGSGAEATAAPDPFLQSLSRDPNDPIVKAYAKQQKIRHEYERELKVIRSKYFGTMRNTEIRQLGISKVRAYTDSALFPTMLEVFAREQNDVRGAILDHFADQNTDDADTTLAWTAVFDKDDWMREQARARLTARMQEVGSVSNRVKSVLANALRSSDNRVAGSAAEITSILGLIEAIPALISAQVTSTPSGGTGNDDTSLAYILVATQQAFVADLTPVVGDSAVAFDPDLGIVTDGVYLRVIDAVVTTYRTVVHAALVDLSTRAWGGQSTASMKYDQNAWRTWYEKEFVPYQREQQAKAQGERGK